MQFKQCLKYAGTRSLLHPNISDTWGVTSQCNSRGVANPESVLINSCETMPVPFEALLPFGVMFIVREPDLAIAGISDEEGQMFGVSGIGLSTVRTWNNGGKRQRYCIGRWEEVSILRGCHTAEN